MANLANICIGDFGAERDWMSVFSKWMYFESKNDRKHSGHNGPEGEGDMGRSWDSTLSRFWWDKIRPWTTFWSNSSEGTATYTVPLIYNSEDAETAGKGDLVPSPRLVLAARWSSKDGFFLDLLVRFLCVHFLLGGCEGRSCWTASLWTFTLFLYIPFSFLML